MRPSRTPFTPEFGSSIDLPRNTRHEWVESVASHDGTSSLHFLGTSLSPRRISLVFFVITAVTFLFGARAGYLQLFEGSGFA
ncbi:MAG: hypothetical protein AAB855_01275, partial [Patescibacteria group bacterium]